MNCSHSLGVAGQPCPFCKQIVPDAYGLSAYAGGANTATPREFVPGVAADREAAGGTSPRVVGSGRGQSTPAPSSTLAAEREPLTPDGDTGQGSLFARGAVPPPAAPRARFTDPVTSHEAARAVTADRQRDAHRLVLQLLAEHGPLSDFDLARLTGLKQTSVGVRRGELVELGQVERFDRAGVSDTGRACIRWALTAKENAA